MYHRNNPKRIGVGLQAGIYQYQEVRLPDRGFNALEGIQLVHTRDGVGKGALLIDRGLDVLDVNNQSTVGNAVTRGTTMTDRGRGAFGWHSQSTQEL